MKGHYAMGGKNSTKFLIIAGFVLVVLVLAATLLVMFVRPRSSTTNETCSDETGKAEVIMKYTNKEEFGPNCLRITSGSKITYQNDSASDLDIGADPHPIHTGNREFSNGQFDLMIKPGQKASVTVKQKGTFGIHNHVNSSATAKIIVE